MTELWKTIPEFPNYGISDQGRVVNTDRDLVLRSSINQQGLLYIRFGLNGVQISRAIAPIVAEMFVPPHSNPRCNTPMHLNGDRTDCRALNLVWRPRWFVVDYHRQFQPAFNPVSFPYPIYCVNTDEVFDDVWDATVRFGLLQNRLRYSIVNNTTIFPDNLKFEYAYTDEE